MHSLQLITAFAEFSENAVNRRMADRAIVVVVKQVLLADIGNIAVLRIFGEQMVKGLILGRTDFRRDRVIPFIAVGENRINIKDHAAKIKHPVPNNFPNPKPRAGDIRNPCSRKTIGRVKYMCHDV
jgi:hypothetical protein